MKILNLYAGIGGNRLYWGDEHDVVAVEYKESIANVYKTFFPNDEVVIGDAHKYLLDHFEEFDFIWSSPPCPSHSKVRKAAHHQNKPIFPDMTLYQEILFLKGYFKGKWCVENVVAWYEPLVRPQQFGNHWFWTNFAMPPFMGEKRGISGKNESINSLEKRNGFNLETFKGIDKKLALRNCVEPELGKHILDWSLKEWHHTQSIFQEPTPKT